MKAFLEAYDLMRFNQEEVEKLKRSNMTTVLKAVIYKHSTNKSTAQRYL